MLILNKENIVEYLKEKIPELDYSKPLIISMVGEGNPEEDGDGYLNFIFRVSDGNVKIIVKQGRTVGRMAGFTDLSTERTRLEYESMKIREAIVPEYIPKVYFYDADNQIFVTEDVSYLQIARFQLNKSVQFPHFASQAADFLARTHFYSSEFYLDTEQFRELDVHFTNHKMRDIFDNLVFLSSDGDKYTEGLPLSEEVKSFIKDIVFDSDMILARYQLRDKFMSKSEALLHADFHTSNIFLGEDEMKVIDMEYAFCGPMSFDLGYLQGNLISQYICAEFRDYDKEEDKLKFQSYILSTMKCLFDKYCEIFFTCWDKDAKVVYKNVPGLKEHLKEQMLHDMIGYCGTANLFRVVSDIDFPEYSALPEKKDEYNALGASVVIDHKMIVNRNSYLSTDNWIDDMIKTLKVYCNILKKTN